MSKYRYISIICIVFLLILSLYGCGGRSIEGIWSLDQIMVGDETYDADTFLDPTGENPVIFTLNLKNDNTVISKGQIGSQSGSSQGTWESQGNDEYQIEIDGVGRKASLAGNLLMMEIEDGDVWMTLIFKNDNE